MRNVEVLLAALALLTAAPSFAAAADNPGTTVTRAPAPGDGSPATATQPPAGRPFVPHNTSERLRALHPEAVLGTAVALLLTAGVVLSILMIRDAFGRPHPVTTRRWHT